MFPPMILTKLLSGFFEILSFWYFFEKIEYTIVPFGQTKNLNYLEQEAQGTWHSAWTEDPVHIQECFEKF